MKNNNSDIDLASLLEKIEIFNSKKNQAIQDACTAIREDSIVEELMGRIVPLDYNYSVKRELISIRVFAVDTEEFYIYYGLETKSFLKNFNSSASIKLLSNEHARALFQNLVDEITKYSFLESGQMDFPIGNGLVATFCLNGNGPTYKFSNKDDEKNALRRVRVPKKGLNTSFINMIDIAENSDNK